nr:hypothetical protein [Tanacetum cinerariifolium]
MWVMIELDKVVTKEQLLNHLGIKSWFLEIKDVVDDFVSQDRIVWMDIEGIPLKAWSRETFTKIGKKWESFKIIVKGKIYMVHAKELFTWNPVFKTHKVNDCDSDGESGIEPLLNNGNEVEGDDEYASDVNEVPETVFEANHSSNLQSKDSAAEQHSADPFGLYDLINKQKVEDNGKSSPLLSHPPRFTPEFMEDHNVDKANDNQELLNAQLTKVDPYWESWKMLFELAKLWDTLWRAVLKT